MKSLVLTERNFRKHLVFAILAVVLGIIVRLTINEWLWVTLAIFMVVTAEVLNTVVESIVDLVVGERYEAAAKKAKDVAAGGVLLAAFFCGHYRLFCLYSRTTQVCLISTGGKIIG
ncbi:diacylglycerol kinase family protein [Secundilactobacillus collinoides]|uniref:diacylglycerol kinase family protein n=1 Tax=Secundilactobacillus collinoides TaxID=33960 RepID=UPI0034E2ACEF